MGFESLVLVALAPGLFWLWFFVRFDRYRPARRRLLGLSFLLGAVSTVPALVIETLTIDDSVLEPDAALASVAFAMLVVVGPVEELSKFAAVRLGAFRSAYYEEPMDALVHGAAASLGFASLENLGYVLAFGPEVMIVRAPLSTLAHVVFGSVWSYGLAKRKSAQPAPRGLLLLTLLGAASIHAAFNVFAFAFVPIALLLVVLGAVAVHRLFLWGQRESPLRYRRNYPLVHCASCDQLIRVSSSYCRFCGTLQMGKHGELVCGHCGHVNASNALYCASCGDRLVTGVIEH